VLTVEPSGAGRYYEPMRCLLFSVVLALGCDPTATPQEDDQTLPYEPFNGGVQTGDEVPAAAHRGNPEDDAACSANAPAGRLACHFAARARRVMADADIRVTGADLVRVDEREIAMDSLRVVCERDPDSCDRRLDDWIAAIAEAREAQHTPARPEQLRPVLKHVDFVATMRRNAPELADLTRRFVGDVHVVLVVDFPRVTRGLDRNDLAALGMTVEQAHSRAVANLRERHGDLPVESMPNGLKAMGPTDGYAAARLLLHDRWSSVAESLEGDLVVAPCNRDLVILGVGTPELVEALREASIRAYRYVDHPITQALWRWTPEGWQVLEDDASSGPRT